MVSRLVKRLANTLSSGWEKNSRTTKWHKTRSWDASPPSNSHHQDYYKQKKIVGYPYKHSICHASQKLNLYSWLVLVWACIDLHVTCIPSPFQLPSVLFVTLPRLNYLHSFRICLINLPVLTTPILAPNTPNLRNSLSHFDSFFGFKCQGFSSSTAVLGNITDTGSSAKKTSCNSQFACRNAKTRLGMQ